MRRCLIYLCAIGALVIAAAPSSAADMSRMLRGSPDIDAAESGEGAGSAARPARKSLGLRKGKRVTARERDDEDGDGSDEDDRPARRNAGLRKGTQPHGRATRQGNREEDEEDEDEERSGRNGKNGKNGKNGRSERSDRTGGKGKSAGKSGRRGGGRSDEDEDENERTDTWSIFGFTEGSDIGDKGDRTLFHDVVGRFSRRDKGYAALRGTAGLAYTATERLNVSVAIQSEYEHNHRGWGRTGGLRGEVSDFGGPEDEVFGLRSSIAFGLSAAAKYRLLERGTSPVGVAVQLAPYWQRSSDSKGVDTDRHGAEFRLLTDVALVPERLFAGFNLAYTPEAAQTNIGLSERTSDLEASAAISGRVASNVFLGAELRHLSRYNGYFFESAAGWALFAGPTLYISLSESAYVGAAWSVQLAGRSADEPGRGLDLENFERHQLRLKSGITF